MCIDIVSLLLIGCDLKIRRLIINSVRLATIGCVYVYESHPRQLIFLRKSDCLGCAVLLCLVVCLTLLASSFLLIHLSLKHVHVYVYMYVCDHRLYFTQMVAVVFYTDGL